MDNIDVHRGGGSEVDDGKYSIIQMILLTDTHLAWLIVQRPNRPWIPSKNWSHLPNGPINSDPIEQTPL
jgi:hypothetical protein